MSPEEAAVIRLKVTRQLIEAQPAVVAGIWDADAVWQQYIDEEGLSA